uniref:Ig-like domain-containing protein n=1 Tax=Cyprinus carpio TaxID=7962 RepID=A0A8C2Q554_CYPCA
MIKAYIFQVEIKKRSRVPGVMITQYVKELPRRKTTPDFTRKPITLTVQQMAFFKAVVNGDPAPAVTWAPNKGDTSDPEKYKPRYDERTREHVLDIVNVQVDQADTYKCFATNQFGKAMCTATLGVFDDEQTNDPEDFRKMLRKTTNVKKRQEKPKKEGEIDPKFWEVMLSAKKSDYERICKDEIIKIEVKTSGRAEFEFNMKPKDPNSKIYLYKVSSNVFTAKFFILRSTDVINIYITCVLAVTKIFSFFPSHQLVPAPSTVSVMVTLQRPPSILVTLKLHTPPKGNQCYMTCAVRGCPTPYIAWYHNGIFRPEDSGEYKVVAVNPFGRAECSFTLKVKGMTAAVIISRLENYLPQSPDLHAGFSFVNKSCC